MTPFTLSVGAFSIARIASENISGFLRFFLLSLSAELGLPLNDVLTSVAADSIATAGQIEVIAMSLCFCRSMSLAKPRVKIDMLSLVIAYAALPCTNLE